MRREDELAARREQHNKDVATLMFSYHIIAGQAALDKMSRKSEPRRQRWECPDE